jgi:hypothetical protein
MGGDGGQPPAWNDRSNDTPESKPSSDTPPPGSGWNDPYGPPTQPGWDPHAQYGGQYGGGPYGGPYGGAAPQYVYLTPQPDPPTPGSTVAALVCNIVAVSTCFNILAIPGIVTAAIAMSRHKTDPERAKTLTVWSWTFFGIAIATLVILIAVAGIIDATDGTDYEDV